LATPWWRPPDWLFGPAWAVLYTLIAVAGWLVWQRDGVGTPILVYLVSLGFNAGWSAIFFGLRRIDWALLWILGLWLSIVAVIATFAPVSTTAAVLLLPYLAWVAFAAALNGSIWRLNRGRPAPAG
jgi:tryptophan-rich sensory protein